MSAKRGVFYSVAANGLIPAGAFLAAPILARALSVEERGQVAAVSASVQLVVALFGLGLPDAATYFAARSQKHGNAAVRRAILLSILLGGCASIVLFFCAPLVAPGSSETQLYIQVCSAAALPTLVLLVLRGTASGQQQWERVLGDNLISTFARLSFLLLLSAAGSLTPLVASIAMSVTGFLGLAAYFRSRTKDSHAVHKEPGERVLKYSTGVWFGTLGGVLLSTVDQVLMSSLSSNYELGIYAVAVSVSGAVLVFNTAVRSVILSVEARSASLERLTRAARVSTAVTLLLVAVTAAITPWGVPLLFGADYAPAVKIIWILLLSTVLGNAGSIAGMGLMARGWPLARSLSMTIAAVINVALVAAFVGSGGAEAAAWATVVAGAIAGNVNIFLAKKFTGVAARDFYGLRMSDCIYLIGTGRSLMNGIVAALRRKRG